jgi:hypothetical protein
MKIILAILATIIVWSVVISLIVAIASVPSLNNHFMSNITSDGMTGLYVIAMTGLLAMAAYLVRNHLVAKRTQKSDVRQ